MSQDLNRLPTFLVIGTNKAGTSTLYSVLKAHPQVFLPYRKELHFFNDDTNSARSNPASRLRAPKLNAWLRSRSGVGRIARRLLSERMLSYVRKGLRRPFLASFSYPPTDPRTESDLRWRYLPDVRKLEAMLGRDLSRWYPEGAGSAADTPP